MVFNVNYIGCMAVSIRHDVLIDKCVGRCRKLKTLYALLSMQFLVILAFYELFRNFSVLHYHSYRRLFHVCESIRQSNKSLGMDFHTFYYYLSILDFVQTIDEMMNMLLHAYYDLMPDMFHARCIRLHVKFEYLWRRKKIN